MRKSWFRAVVFAVLAVVTVLDFFRIFPTDDYTQNRRRSYNAVFAEYGGVPNEEKLREFAERAGEVEGALFSGMQDVISDDYFTENAAQEDALLNYEVKPQIEYMITYPNISNKTALIAYENITLYKQSGRTYDAAENALIYKLYSGRSVPELHGNRWAARFFSHDFSSLACLIMLVLGLSGSFSTERESGMNTLIGAYGKKRKTVAAKVLSAALFCAFLTIWFTAFDLAAFNIFDKLDGIDMPLYSLSAFKYTPLDFSILQTILFWCVQRFLALFAVAAALYLISELSPNTVISAVAGFALCMLLVLLGGLWKSVFNPVSALVPDGFITEFKSYDVFGTPLLQPYAVLIVLAAESIVLCGSIVISEKAQRRQYAAI